jgi:hypothetical protein
MRLRATPEVPARKVRVVKQGLELSRHHANGELSPVPDGAKDLKAVVEGSKPSVNVVVLVEGLARLEVHAASVAATQETAEPSCHRNGRDTIA